MTRIVRPTTLRLPNEEFDRHTTWLEIFFDLIFGVIIVQLSDRLSNQFNLIGILECSALFIPSMWTWASYTVFAARFDNDDAIHWTMTFVIMFAGAIMATQIPTALEEGRSGFSIGFLISQISILILYSRTLNENGNTRNMTLFYMTGFGLGAIGWIISLFFDPPLKYIFWIIGMSIYFFTPWIGKKRILAKAPLDTVYIPERFGSFTIIILGQIIASVVFGLETAKWHLTSVLTSMMAFLLAIVIWGQYYRFTKIADYKCTLGSGQHYIYSHIPLIMSLMIIGVCAKDLIVNPVVGQNVKVIFCTSIVVYLLQFYYLQTIAIYRFTIRGLFYVGGVIAILGLFFLYPLSSLSIMTGTAMIFIVLFALQYQFEQPTNKICR